MSADDSKRVEAVARAIREAYWAADLGFRPDNETWRKLAIAAMRETGERPGGAGDGERHKRILALCDEIKAQHDRAEKAEQERDEWRAERDKLALAYERIEQERDEARGRAERLEQERDAARAALAELHRCASRCVSFGPTGCTCEACEELKGAIKQAEKALGAGRGE